MRNNAPKILLFEKNVVILQRFGEKSKTESVITFDPTNRNLVHFINRRAKSKRFRVYELFEKSYTAWSIISLCFCRVYQSLVCDEGRYYSALFV